MHALDASCEEEEEEEEERPPRSVVRQTGLTRTQKMRITPLKLFFGTIQISCDYPLIVTATLTKLYRLSLVGGIPFRMASNANITYEWWPSNYKAVRRWRGRGRAGLYCYLERS